MTASPRNASHGTQSIIEPTSVTMSDGALLRTDVYRPADGSAVPVVLVRTPYSEPMQRALPIQPALRKGFAVVVQYCRGTSGSDGELLPFENEQEDGLDTFRWLRQQPWCDGRITMFGASYLGMTQNAVAGRRPEGLTAMVQSVTTHDYRDGLVYQQGAVQLGQGLGWHVLKTAQSLADRAGRGEDVRASFGAFAQMTADMDAAYRTLPPWDLPAVTDVLPSWKRWFDREEDRAYWTGFGFTDERAETSVPVLHIGGWFDLFITGTLDNFRTLSERATDLETRQNQHLVVGPWTHVDQTGNAGERFFGAGAAAAIDLEGQQLRFLLESVEGRSSSLPPVQIFVMGRNTWRSEQEWPLARTRWEEWALGNDGALLPPGKPARDDVVTFRTDPADPVPTVGGRTLMNGGPDGGVAYQPGSRDQRVLDNRTDILRFTSPELDQDLEVTGPVTAVLHVSTSVRDADFTAKLVDVHPDGRAMNVVDGIVRLRYRAGMDQPSVVKPEAVYEVSIDMAATAYVFAAGHRLRVDVAGSNFPCFDRNTGTGKLAGEVDAADLRPFTQSIHLGTAQSSRITLPVIPNQ